MYKNKKCICLISLVFLLAMAGNVLAAVTYNQYSGPYDGDWNTGANWALGRVPITSDKAGAKTVGGPLVAASTPPCGEWTLGGTAGGIITINSGGSVSTVIGDGTGRVSMGQSVGENGTLQMNGGTATFAGILDLGYAGTGHINLYGGTIDAANFAIGTAGGNGTMDITAGTLKIVGDKVSLINSYIASGWITAYGGLGTVNVDYNVRNPGKTTVTATEPAFASDPSPANGAAGVALDADLSWTAGIYAVSHDVYFGTDSTPDSTEFQGNQTATTFDPGTLATSTTYYWRIDEVNSTNPASPWIGQVWSFTTQSGTATLKKGPYLIYPGNNTQMTVLWQLDSSATCTIVWGTDTTYSDGSANTTEYGTDHQHKYTITTLTPGTKYYYKVTVGAGFSTGSFRAAPPATASNVKFLLYGDTRTYPAIHDTVCAAMVNTFETDPNYQTILLHDGDFVENGTIESYWTDEFFDPALLNIREMLANIPLNGAQGNHERQGGGPGYFYLKYWPYPYVGGYYWSYDYGPAHIVVVDEYVSYATGSAQYNWLVNDLASTTKDWVFIISHEPGYSAGGHADNPDVQNYLQPLCEQYGVAIYLAGHNHYYARCAKNGVKHITTGGGGAPLSDGNINYSQYVEVYVKANHYCKINITGTQLDFVAVKPDGTVIDTFTIGGTLPLPGKATNPSPANSATNVATNATLSWTAGSDATSHDVYFGTTSPGTFKGNQTATTYNPGTLALSTTYYWRIDEKNATGTTTGDVWSFTTTSIVAAPTFVAAGAVATNTAAITPALPAGIAANDILLLFLETANQAISISNQNGGTWTEVTNSPQGTGATRLTVFWSRYNGTQGVPTASDSGDHQTGRIIAIRGATTSGNPWDVTAGGVESTSDTSGSIPGATTTVANTLVVAAIATDLPDATGTANFSAWTNANLTSVTERTDNTSKSGNGGGLGIATGVKATAGAYGNTTVTAATSAVKGMMSIALKP
jgi:hypothetical protein